MLIEFHCTYFYIILKRLESRLYVLNTVSIKMRLKQISIPKWSLGLKFERSSLKKKIMDGIWVLNVFVTQSWFPTSHSQKYHHFPFAKIILCQTVCTSTSFVSKHDKVAQVKSEKINDFFLLCMNAIILYDFSYIKFSLANHGVWQKYKCKLSRTKGKNFKFYLNIRIQLWDDATLFYFRFIFYDGFFLWFCSTIIRSIIIIWRFWQMNVIICVK